MKCICFVVATFRSSVSCNRVSEVGDVGSPQANLLTSDLAHRFTSSAADTERHWNRANGLNHHISTHNLPLVTMASAGKITKTLASMGGRQEAIKARHFALEPGYRESSTNTTRRSTPSSPSVSGQRSTTSSPSTLAVPPVFLSTRSSATLHPAATTLSSTTTPLPCPPATSQRTPTGSATCVAHTPNSPS